MALTRLGEQRTENRTPLRATGEAVVPITVRENLQTFFSRKDAKGGANRFGLRRSLCGYAADRDRRPPVRALPFLGNFIRRPNGALLYLLNLLHLLLGRPSDIRRSFPQRRKGRREPLRAPSVALRLRR